MNRKALTVVFKDDAHYEMIITEKPVVALDILIATTEDGSRTVCWPIGSLKVWEVCDVDVH